VLSNIFYTFAARILVMKEMNKCLTMVAAAMMAANDSTRGIVIKNDKKIIR
jgi:hypothetical protein